MRVTDLADASRSWTMFVGDGHTTTAAVGGDRLLFAHRGRLLAFTVERPDCTEVIPGVFTCTPLWERTLPANATTPVLSVDGATVFVGDAAGNLWALDATDGAVRWRAELGGSGARGLGAAPTVGDGRVYAVATDGSVFAFAADGCGAPTCAPLWSASTGGPVSRQAALAGGVLYVGGEDGALDAFLAAGCRRPTCRAVWDESLGSEVTGGPVVAGGRLLVGTADGRLIAFRPPR
jgi:outer membrane protein assembly factor BamB